MPETCDPNNCLVFAKVESLRDEFKTYRESASETHKDLYQRVGDLEKAEAAQEKHFETVNEKLDKLIEWQEDQRDKPGKRLDALTEKIIWAICAAIITFLLARIGL